MGRQELERMMGTPGRPGWWKWVVSGLLLFATMVNYLDRQTLANLAPRITSELQISPLEYGNIEFAFACAFGAGSLFFGFVADRVSVRWLYPAVLVLWSAVGILTGFVESYAGLLACRTLLGLFEAGHWPCALKTTQHLLAREDRTMGNSVLQSGAAFGAILTPLVVLGILRWADPGEPVRWAHLAAGGGPAVAAAGLPPAMTWRWPFLIVGGIGLLWVIGWLAVVRGGDLPTSVPAQAEPAAGSIWSAVWDRRFAVLLVAVTCLNVSWQLIRAWLPKFLIEGRDYPEAETLYFNSLYYVAAGIGSLLAGSATLRLARRGVPVHRSRVVVFGVCAALTALTVLAALMPPGWAMLGVLLVVAAGSLGLFPCYYSFSQELTARHMGKVTGLLGACGWFLSAPFQSLFGWRVEQTKSYDLGLALVGLPPLVALVVMVLFWERRRPPGDGKMPA